MYCLFKKGTSTFVQSTRRGASPTDATTCLVKESLKLRQDQEAVLYMTSLGEFESYFRMTYIVGQNLVQDLLSRLFDKQKPTTYEKVFAKLPRH